MKHAASPMALQAENLSVSLGQGRRLHPVLNHVDVAIHAGRWTSIVGPNGAGKSTLLRALAGLLPLQVGHVQLLGKDLATWSSRARAQTLAWLAQGGASDMGADDLLVRDVAMLGRLPHQGWLSPPSPKDLAVVEAALKKTHAWPWRDRPFGALSGGERQRVLLARLLAVQAEVLLMDEPLANLDPPHQADWIDLVRDQVAEGGTVVSVLHEISMALLADDLIVMREGQVIYAGPAHQPEAHEAISAVFDHRLRIHSLGDRWVALPQ